MGASINCQRVLIVKELDGSEQEALAQIKQNEYYVRYRSAGKALHLVGVNFDSNTRQVAAWQEETLE